MALRCQLPRANAYYEPAAGAEEPKPTPGCPRLCAVCGARGGLLCSSCKGESYCSKVHQKAAWRTHKKACKARAREGTAVAAPMVAPSVAELFGGHVFPAYEVRVVGEAGLKAQADAKALSQRAAVGVCVKGDESVLSSDEEERRELASMRQRDVIGRGDVDSSAMRDPFTFKFMLETAVAKSQVRNVVLLRPRPQRLPACRKSFSCAPELIGPTSHRA